MWHYCTQGLVRSSILIFALALLLLPMITSAAPHTQTTRTFALPATRASWTTTSITLQNGDLLRVQASGKVSYWDRSSPNYTWCDPNGRCDNGRNYGNRIEIRIGTTAFLGGRDTTRTITQGGGLSLRVKDSKHADNDGNHGITIKVWRKNDTMRHADAFSMVQSVGIGVRSSSGYVGPDRSRTNGTSLEQVKAESIGGIVDFKRACGCTVTITGGSEDGHATNLNYTHGGGWKLDTSTNAGIDRFILNRSDYVGTGSGYPMYRDRTTGYYYRDERSRPGAPHWDIQFNTNAPSDLRP